MHRSLGLALLIVLAACRSDQAASAVADEGATSAAEQATPEEAPVEPAPTAGPHQGVIAVVDVIQAPSSETSARLVALLLKGDAGTSAIIRTLGVTTFLEPIDGSTCDAPPVPTVLRPTHADALQPVLADETRAVVMRSLANDELDAGSASLARFQAGPVPSVNGAFEGWLSFHVPVASADGFCAVDVSGVVQVVAGETTTAELPAFRVDTRVPLDRP